MCVCGDEGHPYTGHDIMSPHSLCDDHYVVIKKWVAVDL